MVTSATHSPSATDQSGVLWEVDPSKGPGPLPIRAKSLPIPQAPEILQAPETPQRLRRISSTNTLSFAELPKKSWCHLSYMTKKQLVLAAKIILVASIVAAFITAAVLTGGAAAAIFGVLACATISLAYGGLITGKFDL